MGLAYLILGVWQPCIFASKETDKPVSEVSTVSFQNKTNAVRKYHIVSENLSQGWHLELVPKK